MFKKGRGYSSKAGKGYVRETFDRKKKKKVGSASKSTKLPTINEKRRR